MKLITKYVIYLYSVTSVLWSSLGLCHFNRLQNRQQNINGMYTSGIHEQYNWP